MSLRAAARQLALLSSTPLNTGQAMQQTRAMAGHAGGVTYKGVTIHDASNWHKAGAEVLGGLMWSWLMIRAYEDGEALLFGHVRHFEHELHEMEHGAGSHDDEGHGDAAHQTSSLNSGEHLGESITEGAKDAAHNLEELVSGGPEDDE